MDIALALYKIDPTYYYSGNDYASLTMLDGRAKPSLLELHDAWAAWLNENAKTDTLAKLEWAAEAERLKYVTGGSGKAMAYQQQQREVERWESGVTNPKKFPVATEYAAKLGITVEDALTIWQTNINSWLVIGAKIEANLVKAKRDLVAMSVTSQADLDNFLANINWIS